MSGWLLDTNVISETRRPEPAAAVISFLREQALSTLFISVVTLAELRFGLESLADLRRRTELRDWIESTVRARFAGRTLHMTEEILLRWRILLQTGRRSGHTFSQPDLLIAATAAVHGHTVVTRDVRDFALAGVPVLNPWPAAGTDRT